MKAVCIHDKRTLETFLLKHRALNYYTLGDLDDFFWPHTTWYALKEDDLIQALVLIYTGTDLPVLLAINNDNQAQMLALLEAVRSVLPKRIYAHLSPGLEGPLQADYQLEHHGEHFKMSLVDPTKLKAHETSSVQALTSGDLNDLLTLYEVAYPGNWFDPRMLETKQYFGIRHENGTLISAAGVHVYSTAYKIAAIGNITTHPDHRGQGLGTATTARLCHSLLKTVDSIGLNVLTDNAPAIRSYRKLGFEVLTTYHEYMLELRQLG